MKSSAKGTVSQLLVSAWLIRRGWNVFSALDPNSPIDLMACSGSVTMSIDVTSTWIGKDGRERHNKTPLDDYIGKRVDALAIVSPDSYIRWVTGNVAGLDKKAF